MTIVVPFDGSDLAESALVRATALGDAFDVLIVRRPLPADSRPCDSPDW